MLALGGLALPLAGPVPLATSSAVPAAVPIAAPPVVSGPFPFTEEEVPVALLIDVSAGKVLYSRNPDRRFLPASVTKTMTALVAFDMIAQGQVREDAQLEMKADTFRDWAGKGSRMFLSVGDRARISDLLNGIMNISANDASAMLAVGLAGSIPGWAARMNARAKALGMSGSHFNTPNGWPDEGATYVTASDLVRLGQELLFRHPDLYRRYIGHPGMVWNGIAQPNHDPLLGKVPGADGIKTGFTNEAGYNYLGTVERDGRRLMLVIGAAQSGRIRAKAAQALVDWGYSAWASRPLVGAGNRIGKARVQGGTARSVALVVPRRYALTFPNGQTPPAVTTRIVYKGPIRAPVARGAEVATLEVLTPGQGLARIPLEAGESVGTAGPVDRLVNGLAALVP